MLIIQQDSFHPEINAFGVGQVIKMDLRQTKKGNYYWNIFMDFDFEYKRDEKNAARCMNVTVFLDKTSKRIANWNKGEILVACGKVTKNVRNGKEYLNFIATWVHDMHDYATAHRASKLKEAVDEAESSEYYDPNDYDPGF